MDAHFGLDGEAAQLDFAPLASIRSGAFTRMPRKTRQNVPLRVRFAVLGRPQVKLWGGWTLGSRKNLLIDVRRWARVVLRVDRAQRAVTTGQSDECTLAREVPVGSDVDGTVWLRSRPVGNSRR